MSDEAATPVPEMPRPVYAPEMPRPSPEFENIQLREKLEKLEAEAERVRQLLRASGELGIILKGQPVVPSLTPYTPVPLDQQVALYIARNSHK